MVRWSSQPNDASRFGARSSPLLQGVKAGCQDRDYKSTLALESKKRDRIGAGRTRARRLAKYRSISRFSRAFRGAHIPSGEAALLCEWSQIKRLAPKLRLLKASFAIVNLSATHRNPTATGPTSSRLIAVGDARLREKRAGQMAQSASVLRYSPMILISTRLRRPPSNSP